METPPPLPPPPQQQPILPRQDGAGCFAKGCLVVVIAGFILVAVIGAGAWYFYGKTISIFTSPQPADVRIEQGADVDLRNAEQKLNQLGQATANNGETTIEFTADGFRRSMEKNDQATNIWKHIKTIGLDRDKLVIVTQRL